MPREVFLKNSLKRILGLSLRDSKKLGRAKSDAPKVTEPNLRFPAVFSAKIFGFLQKSAVFCGFLRPPNAGISKGRGESAKICGFLRKSAFWVFSVTLVPSP